jgi:hypothetical protein
VTARGEIIDLPLLFDDTLDINGGARPFDISAEINNMRALISSNELVPLVEGDVTTQVYVEDFRFTAHHATGDGKDMNGTLLLKLKTFSA